jgi:hypothetical protein
LSPFPSKQQQQQHPPLQPYTLPPHFAHTSHRIYNNLFTHLIQPNRHHHTTTPRPGGHPWHTSTGSSAGSAHTQPIFHLFYNHRIGTNMAATFMTGDGEMGLQKATFGFWESIHPLDRERIGGEASARLTLRRSFCLGIPIQGQASWNRFLKPSYAPWHGRRQTKGDNLGNTWDNRTSTPSIAATTISLRIVYGEFWNF